MRTVLDRLALCAALCLICAPTLTEAQTFTTLYDFTLNSDGAFPVGALVQGEDGNYYGVTGLDTAFEITPSGGLTLLSASVGLGARAGLLLAANGNFYGTTESGGTNYLGSIFEITPSGALTTLYNFDGTDGSAPFAPLIQAIDGNLYGTTVEGGSGSCSRGCGTVFRINYAGRLTTLHSFTNSTDGGSPYGGLIQGSDGDFYGTTAGGGAWKMGTVFKITAAGALTTLHAFKRGDGQGPNAGLIQGIDGDFYGTTVGGGANNEGTVFKMNRSGYITTLHSFDGTDGMLPYAGVIQATDGGLYGVTPNGGNYDCGGGEGRGCGTLFSISAAGAFATLQIMNFSDGANATGGLLQATSGIFYGMAPSGGLTTCDGPYGCGTVFTLDMGLAPFVAFVRAAGKVGQNGGILGQGFTGTTAVAINDVPAKFEVVSDTYLTATVPSSATTGYVTVTTPTGVLTSNVPFHVIP